MTAVRTGFLLALAALVSWADYTSGAPFLALITPLLGAILFLYCFPLWPSRAYWSRAAVVTVASLWLVALPWVGWNHMKRFYRDCGRIEAGWSIEEAKAIMAPYVLHNVAAGKADPRNEFDEPHLTFWPDRTRSADWCVVFVRGERVREAAAFPD